MRHFLLLVLLALLFGAAALLFGAPTPSRAGGRTTVSAGPSSDCTITPLAFRLSGTGTIGASRPFSVTDGDLFAQFIAPVITATSLSAGYVTVNDSYSGTVTGGITGTFAIDNLNGLLITNPGGIFAAPRGIQVNQVVLTDTTGTMTAVMAVDFAALTLNPYPRTFNAYLHSTGGTGRYADEEFEGAIALGTMTLSGNTLSLSGNVLGFLYTGGSTINESLLAYRTAPPNRATAFEAQDAIAQFRRSDFLVGAAASGHVNPMSTFTGTTTISGTVGGFVLNHNTVLVDGGPNSGKGWLVGGFDFADPGGDIIIAPWLSDVTSNQFSTSISGYMFRGIGTGVYTDSLLFAQVDGTVVGQSVFAGTMTGSYCSGILLPTPVPTATAAATSTATPGTATVTPVPPTPCPLQFSDVPPENPFYPYVRCLACRGILGGYSDGTFRPNNNITRGQIAKIVSNAAGFSDDVTGRQTYADVPSAQTFWQWIERLTIHQVMSGYQCGGAGEPCDPQNRPYFRPYANATRAQLAKIDSNAAGYNETPTGQAFTDVPPDHPFYLWIERLAERGIMGGYPCGGPGEPCDPQNRPYFRPYNDVTRGQASKIVANTFYPNCQTPSRR